MRLESGPGAPGEFRHGGSSTGVKGRESTADVRPRGRGMKRKRHNGVCLLLHGPRGLSRRDAGIGTPRSLRVGCRPAGSRETRRDPVGRVSPMRLESRRGGSSTGVRCPASKTKTKPLGLPTVAPSPNPPDLSRQEREKGRSVLRGWRPSGSCRDPLETHWYGSPILYKAAPRPSEAHIQLVLGPESRRGGSSTGARCSARILRFFEGGWRVSLSDGAIVV